MKKKQNLFWSILIFNLSILTHGCFFLLFPCLLKPFLFLEASYKTFLFYSNLTSNKVQSAKVGNNRTVPYFIILIHKAFIFQAADGYNLLVLHLI